MEQLLHVYMTEDLLGFSEGSGRGRRMHASCCGQSSHEIISQLVKPHNPTQPAADQARTETTAHQHFQQYSMKKLRQWQKIGCLIDLW